MLRDEILFHNILEGVMRSSRIVSCVALLVGAVSILCLASPTGAQTYIWDGQQTGSGPSDGDNTWDGSTYNWYHGASTYWIDGKIAQFGYLSGNTNPYAVTLGANVAPTGITFTDQYYTIAPDFANQYGLTIGGNGIAANASGAISAPVTLGAPQTWTAAAGQQLTIGGNVNNGGNLLTVSGSGATTVAAPISGLGGLTKNGAGTLTLTAPSSFTGATTIAGGTISLVQGSVPMARLADSLASTTLDTTKWMANTSSPLNAPQVNATTNGVQLVSRGYLNTAVEYDPTQVGGLDITGNWKFTGAGNDMLQIDTRSTGTPGGQYGEVTGGIEFYYMQGNSTPTITQQGGIFTIGNVAAKGTLTVNIGDILSFHAIDDGRNNLSFTLTDLTDNTSASVTATLTGGVASSNYVTFHNREQSGDASLVSNVAISNLSVLPARTPLTIAAKAALDLNGASQQVGSLSDYAPGGGGAVTNSNAANPSVLTVANTGSSIFSGTIRDGAGTIGVVINGSGTQVFAGSNTYTGGTALAGGTLSLASAGALPTAGTIRFIGGTLQATASNTTDYSAQFDTAGGQAYRLDTNGQSVTWAAPLNSPQGSLTKVGAGILTVTGPSTYSGSTTVNGGTVQVGNGGSGASIGGTSNVNLANNATLAFNHSDAASFNAPILGAGNVVKSGGGVLTFGGISSYTGSTVVAGGTVRLTPGAWSLADALTSTTLDPTKWTKNTKAPLNTPQVNPTTSGVQLVDRGYLNTAAQYDPTAVGGLDITGNWKFTGAANDMLQIDTRSTGTPGGQYGEVTGGIEFFYYQGLSSTPTIQQQGGIFSIANLITSGDLNVAIGDTLSFHAIDDGTGNLSFTLTDLANNTTGSATATLSGGVATANYVTFHNREAGGSTSLLSNVVISHVTNTSANGVPPLPIGTPVSLATGATLDLNGASQQVGSLSDYAPGGGGLVTNSSADAAVLTLTPTGSTNFGGAIQNGVGGISLVVKGGGTQVLTGANTYTGSTTVNTGTLQLGDGTGGHDGSLATSGVTVNSALIYNLSGNQTVNYPISGSGSLTKTGGGKLQLGSANSVSAATSVVINNGTLALASGAQMLSNNISIQSGGVFDVTAAPFTLASGQTLTGGRTGTPANDILGSITLGGGVLNIGSGMQAAVLTAAGGTFGLSGGTVNFDLSAVPTSVGGVNDTVDVASLALSNITTLDLNVLGHRLGTGTYNLFNYSNAVTLGNVSNLNFQFIGITTGLTRQTFSLVNNTSTKAVQLSILGNAANLVWSGSDAGAWNVGSTSTVNWLNISLTPNAGDKYYDNDFVTFNDTAVTGSVNVTTNMAPGGLTFNNNTLAYTLSGPGNLSGFGGLSKTGSGIVVLANFNGNDYSGPTTISGGVLVLGSSNAVHNSAVTVNVNNGLEFTPSVGIFVIPSLGFSGGLVLSDTAGGPVNIRTGLSGANAAYNGLISGKGGLNWAGSGTLTLTGANTYGGATTMNAGLLVLGNSNAVQGSTVQLSADNQLVFNSGIHAFNLGGITSANALCLLDTASSPITLSVGGNGQSTTFSGAMTGSGANLTKTGTGMLTLSGSGIGYVGNTTVNGGTLQMVNALKFSNGNYPANSVNIASGAVLEMYTDPNGGGAQNGNDQIIGTQNTTTLSGAGTFRKTGAGTLGISGANNGYLNIAMGAGSLIDIQGGVFQNGGWAAGTWTNNKAALNIAAGATFDVWDGQTVYVDALTGAGTVTKQQGGGQVVLNVGVAGGSGEFSGVIQEASGHPWILLAKSGSGLQVLSGANAYTGPTIVNGGTLQIGNGVTVGSAIGNTNSVTLANNSTLSFKQPDSQSFNTPICGAGNVVKTGAGVLTLGSPNTYQGSTVIAGGTVRLTPPAQTLVADNLLSETLDPAKWTTNTNSPMNGPQVNPTAIGVQLVSRGYLNTANEFDPTTQGGLSVIGNWKFTGITGDMLQIDTRSTGMPGGTYGEVTSGIEFYYFQGNATPTIQIQGSDFTLGAVTTTGNLNVHVGDNLFFQAVDDGQNNLTFYLTDLTDSTTGTAKATLTGGVALNNYVTFHNRESSGASSVVSNVAITSAPGVGLLPAGTTVYLGAASGDANLDLNGATQTIAALANNGTYANGVVTNGAASPAVLALSPTGGMTTAFGGSIQDGVGGVSLVINGNGTQVLSGSNSFTGSTTVSNGALVASSSSALLNTSSLSVATGASFSYRPSGNAALKMGSASLSFADGSTLNAAIASSDPVNPTSIATLGAALVGNHVALNLVGIPGLPPASGTHSVITAAGGGLDTGSPIVGVYNATNFTVSSVSITSTAVTANVIQVPAQNVPTNMYWLGGLSDANNVWGLSPVGNSQGNWATNATGTATALVPGPTATVHFSAAGAANQGSMVLGTDMSIAGATISDTSAVSLQPDGHTLTIGSGGVTVNSGAGAVTLGAAFALSAPQTWTNNSANPLTMSGTVNNGGNLLTIAGAADTVVTGSISGQGGLTKTGAATLGVSAPSSYTGPTAVAGGKLVLSPPVLLADSLLSTTLDSAKWVTNTSSPLNTPQANPTTGGVQLVSRGYLNTAAEFDPAQVGGLTITGVWKFTGATNDFIQIDTRSTAAPGGQYGEVTGALEFSYMQGNSTPSIGQQGGIFTIGNVTTAGNLSVNIGDTLVFRAVDNGSNGLSFTLTDLTNNTSASAATTLLSGADTSNFITFHNREQAGDTSLVSNVVIASGLSGGLASTTPVSISNGATFDMKGILQTIASLSSTDGKGSKVLLGAGILTVGDSTSTTYDGSISGAFGSLAKIGAGTLTLSGSSDYSGMTTVSSGTLALVKGGALTSVGAVFVGNAAGDNGTLDVSGNGAINAASVMLGNNVGSNGTLNMSGNAAMSVATGNVVSIGLSGKGVLDMSGSASISTPGEFNIGNNELSTGLVTIRDSASITCGGIGLYIGRLNASQGSNPSSGTLNIQGGTINTPRLTMALQIGTHGLVNQTGGTMNVVREGADAYSTNAIRVASQSAISNAEYDISGGALNITGLTMLLGESGIGHLSVSGNGLVNISGGADGVTRGGLQVAVNAGSNGTVDLLGGTLETPMVKGGAGTATFNFNGGTLMADASNTAFVNGVTAHVQAGGAKIDTNGFTDTISQSLIHDPALGTTLDGGLTKSGAGTLVLAGNNSYTGRTTVTGGVLDLTSPTAVLDGSSLSVGTGLSVFPGGTAAAPASGSSGVSAVPEPGTLALLAGMALCGLAAHRRMRSRRIAS
jgi:fibronectin-binding autotransporter adhesin